jgi:hypothetical protein
LNRYVLVVQCCQEFRPARRLADVLGDQRTANREGRAQQFFDCPEPLRNEQTLPFAGFAPPEITRQRKELQAFARWREAE